jgi:hypothetical protein
MWAALSIGSAQAAFTENFDDVSALPASGWVLTNNSTSPDLTWFQGGAFDSQAGAPGAYIAANFFSTSDPVGAISNWLITPVLSLPAGGTLTFYTRTADPGFLDLLEVRFSTGSSAATASFGSLLLTVGPGGSYPTGWTPYTVALPAVSSGRLAFVYAVGNALDADLIGVDSLSVSTPSTPPVPEPATVALLGLGLGALAWVRRSKTAT